ncbi:MAG: WD40 repeat domain-containing protein [Gemmataceae bacterium]
MNPQRSKIHQTVLTWLGVIALSVFVFGVVGTPTLVHGGGKKEQKKGKDKGKKPEKEKKKEIPKDKTPPKMVIKGHKYWVTSITTSSDGKYVVTTSRDRSLRVWVAKNGKEISKLEKQPTDLYAAAFSPDGKTVVTATGGWNKKAKKWIGEVRFWNPKTKKVVKTITGHSAIVKAMAFSTNGKVLVTAGEDETAIIWDVKTGKATQTLKGHKGKIQDVAISPNGERIVTASYDNTAKLWDAKSGKELQTFKGPKRAFTSVTFSPNGKLIAAANMDSTIYIWGLDGKEVRKIKAPKAIWALEYSPNGKYLAAGGYDDTIKIYDASTGKELYQRNGHTGSVIALTFTPDNSKLLTGGIDSTVKVWDVPTK